MRAVRCLSTILLILPGETLLPGSSDADPVISWLEMGFTGSCRLPFTVEADRIVPFGGFTAATDARPEEIEALFPAEHQGQRRRFVGLGLRPPGIRMTFEDRAHAVGFVRIYDPGGLVIEPSAIMDASPSSPVELDTVKVYWEPLAGVYHDFVELTMFDGGCAFEIVIAEELLVTATVTVNLVALYGPPENGHEVWGTELGMADIEITDQQLAVAVPVEAGTWGGIRRLFQ